jgi:hypothetical protein
MILKKHNLLLVGLMCFTVIELFSQEADSAFKKKSFLQRIDSIQQWKIERGRATLTPFLAPSYSPEMKLTLTMGGLFTFKLRPQSPVLSRSSVPFSIGYSTNGSLMISIKANIYGKEDKLRITAEYWNKKMPDNYWGVGYLNGRYLEKSDSTTGYQRNWKQFKYKITYEILRNFFIGLNYDYNETRATDINSFMAEDPAYLNHPDHVYNSGFGMVWRYDSRDFPENAFKGVFVELAGTGYGKHTRSNNIFQVYEFDYRQYQRIVRDGSTIAWQIKMRNAEGDVPWTDLSMIGTPFDLRGYTWGQYRDQSMMFLLTEYRYMLPSRKKDKSYSRLGFVAWTGAGSVAESMANLKYWLPNGGFGLRFELQKRMNIRIDYGFGVESSAFYISFNEAF